MFNIKQLIQEPLVRGSFISIIGAVLIGAGNYFFQLLMGRMLSTTEFGSLAALLSLSIILTVPNQVLSLITTKHVSTLYAHKQLNTLAAYARSSAKKILPYSFALLVLMLIFAGFIRIFLNLASPVPLYILGVCFLCSFFSPLGLGIYQGVQNFFQYNFSQFLAVVVKLLFGVILVSLGWGVNGALLAGLLAVLFLINYTVINLKLYKRVRSVDMENKMNIHDSQVVWTTILISFCLVCLYNLDMILVKHFLSATEAGYYAIISLAGKIIIFFTSSISTVMFSISSSNHESKKSNSRIVSLSVLFICIASICIIIVYTFLPEYFIEFLFGMKYISVAGYMWLGGIIFSLYSIVNFLSLYFLAVQKTKFSVILALGTIMEVTLICFFHNCIFSILYSILISMIFMAATLIIYYFIVAKNLKTIYEENINSSTYL